MASNPSNIPGHTSRHCDGTPGLEYFQDGHAFAWTGNPRHMIEVSPGGYGEPVEWLIEPAPANGAPSLLDQFKTACDRWLAQR